MPFFNIFFAETSLDWKPSTFLQREWKNWHRQRTLLSWLFLLLLSLMQRDLPRVRVDTAERGLFKGCLWLCRDMSAWKFIANNDKRMVNLYCLFLFCSGCCSTTKYTLTKTVFNISSLFLIEVIELNNKINSPIFVPRTILSSTLGLFLETMLRDKLRVFVSGISPP